MPHITNTPINIPELFGQAHHAQTGAIVLFSGEVRAANKGKEVLWLEYEAYDSMAEEVIASILDEATKRWQLNFACCVHRVGKLDICDCAVVVITGSGHRDAAYKANRFIIDEVKRKAPIWKNEVFADGTNEWGQNDCHCAHDHDEHHHNH
jgi:molybdopterin synthase catalytic subunit